MCLNLCISSVCSPERGVGGDREGEKARAREREKGVRVEVKEGGYVEEEESKTMSD